jgi:hypothetical protein
VRGGETSEREARYEGRSHKRLTGFSNITIVLCLLSLQSRASSPLRLHTPCSLSCSSPRLIAFIRRCAPCIDIIKSCSVARILFEETGNERGWLVETALRLQFGVLGPTVIHAGETLFDTAQPVSREVAQRWIKPAVFVGDTLNAHTRRHITNPKGQKPGRFRRSISLAFVPSAA